MSDDRMDIGKGRPVTVVGAGFSGLVSAYFLSRKGFQVEVVEEKAEAGGLIHTVKHPLGPVETAANGLMNSALIEELVRDIGVELEFPKKNSRRRYVFRRNGPRRWPLGLGATIRVVWFAIRFLFGRQSIAPMPEESVSSWGDRVLGREATRYTVEAFLQGIYAGDAQQMSARLVFGRIFGMKDSITVRLPKTVQKPSARGTVSVQGGMGSLIDALKRSLDSAGVRFRFGERFCLEPQTCPSHPVILATSSAHAGLLLEEVDSRRAEILKGITLLPVVTATVFYRSPCEAVQGFGCLFPPTENRKALGVLMNSSIFDGRAREGYSETWILGGARMNDAIPGLLEMSDEEILRVIDEEREVCFGAKSERLGHMITKWPEALPHYTTRLEEEIPEIQKPSKNIFLVGNYLGQIGLAKIAERASLLPEEIVNFGDWE